MVSGYSDEVEAERGDDEEEASALACVAAGIAVIVVVLVFFIGAFWYIDNYLGTHCLSYLGQWLPLQSLPELDEPAFAVIVVLLLLVIGLIVWWVRNPFKFPYLDFERDVSGRRAVKMEDVVDGFLNQDGVWDEIEEHEAEIREWESDSRAKASRSLFASHRLRQLESSKDDRAYRFKTLRTQTRYRQRNYVRYPYKVCMVDSIEAFGYGELRKRHDKLADIGFETTLRRYHSKSQRKLMTPELRRQIAERDDYTCQICGKRMRDGVGLQIDHIVPVAKGGKTVPSNLQVLCSKCNARKGAR